MKGNKKYRIIQSELDKIGIQTNIQRVDKKEFQFIVNFEIIKTFKKRESINKRIVKLFKNHKDEQHQKHTVKNKRSRS